MLSHEALKSLPDSVLWEFLKWLAFGQGRYTGIRVEPRDFAGDCHVRIRSLVEHLVRAAKQPEDAALGVSIAAGVLQNVPDDAALVAEVARYLAARQVAMCRDDADFAPRHASEIQDDALRRIQARLDISAR
jgi:hypothetical protein